MPPLTTLDISVVPVSYARFPSIPNTIIPDVNEVIVSTTVIVAAILYTIVKSKLVR